MRTCESDCSKPHQKFSKLLYVLPLVMVGLMALGTGSALAQIDPPDPNGSCNPSIDNACAADDNLCTIEFCNPQTLKCDHKPTCPADGNQCTTEVCNPENGACSSVPANPLPDGCQQGGCDPNAIDPQPCPSDNNPCTSEVCDPSTHQCVSVPANPLPDQCQPGACDPNAIDPQPCPSDDNPCTSEVCDPSTHRCTSVPANPLPDQCQPGACDPNAIDPQPCPSDDNPCTSEVCDPSTHRCTSVPANPLPDQCQPGGCDPNAEAPCPVSDNKCSPNVCSPETHTCVPQPVTCQDGDDPCSTSTCNPETGACEPQPTNPPPDGCVGAVCRTPGFWGTHALTVPKKKAVNITQAVITAAGGTLSICGKAVTSTIVKDDNSAVEGICVSPSGDIRLQLARQLTAAALNCVMSGGGADCLGTPLFSSVFANCNATCSDLAATTASITSCIDDLDCLNNGGVRLANGFCQIGKCTDGTPCNGETVCLDASKCVPLDNNCHSQPLVNADLHLDFDPPGAAGSSSLCNSAIKNGCTIIGSGLALCTQ